MKTTRRRRPYPTLKAYLVDLKREGGTQRAFAKHLGISQATLSDLKNGNQKPALWLAVRLSEEIGIPIESFLGNRPESDSQNAKA